MLLALTGCTNDTFTRLGFPDPITTQGKITLSLWQGSWIAGLLVGLCLCFGHITVRLAMRFYVDLIRGVPSLVLIFFSFYGTSLLGLDISAFTAGVFALAGADDIEPDEPGMRVQKILRRFPRALAVVAAFARRGDIEMRRDLDQRLDEAGKALGVVAQRQ